MQNTTATWEDSLAVPYKTKLPVTIQPSNCTHWYLPKCVEYTCPQKRPHMNVSQQPYSQLPKFRRNQDILQQVNKCGSSIMEYYNLKVKKKFYQKSNQHGITLNVYF